MAEGDTNTQLTARRASDLKGIFRVPSDKSISHRSLLLGSQASGVVRVKHLLEADDVMATKAALEALGVVIKKQSDGDWIVEGVGVGNLKPTDSCIDMGNTGTGVRLLMGLVATYDMSISLTGDASLCSRPMGRVTTPLKKMGMTVVSSAGKEQLPMVIQGAGHCSVPIDYTLPVASAQVKSAILLAGLNVEGKTIVREAKATRDHTERMLQGMGATLTTVADQNGMRVITLEGKPILRPLSIDVPADPSSAAFLTVAALISKGSSIRLTDICMNEHRMGLYTTLREMGADIQFVNERDIAGEKVADICVNSSSLTAVEVPADRAPSMIDEYPILCIAAAVAKGQTVMRGLEELRVKESDRLQVMLDGLTANGIRCWSEGDDLYVEGMDADLIQGGGLIKTHMDHRIAMSFLVLGLVSQQPVTVDDGSMIQTSFPGFIAMMNAMGANIS